MEKELRGYELCPLDNPCYALNSHRPFWSCFYGHSPLSILFHTANDSIDKTKILGWFDTNDYQIIEIGLLIKEI